MSGKGNHQVLQDDPPGTKPNRIVPSRIDPANPMYIQVRKKVSATSINEGALFFTTPGLGLGRAAMSQ